MRFKVKQMHRKRTIVCEAASTLLCDALDALSESRFAFERIAHMFRPFKSMFFRANYRLIRFCLQDGHFTHHACFRAIFWEPYAQETFTGTVYTLIHICFDHSLKLCCF